ncbi:MAG TPA: protein translocase subunit SecF [Alphaproteobacteria bacterium]|nr:protein translocase subunit SecF [Alphaproteobacteria bacterium]
MKIFSWVTKDTNIDFLKPRKWTYTASILLILASFYLMFFHGFNYGIDFSGGVLMEIKSENKINVEEIRQKLAVLDLDELTLQSVGEEGNELSIRAQADNANEESQRIAVVKIKEILGNGYEYRRVESVGPQVGDELKRAGIISSLIAILAICAYVWFRFEWQFALGALLGLFHDIIITVGCLSLFDFDISLTTVAAILTLAGYSVNDTVVNYDRIRENLRKYKKMSQYDLINKSVNDIFSRTILTGLTTLCAAIALFAFGGDALRSFSFVILFGVIIGTYSSIYISCVFLNVFDLRKTQENRERQENANPFGNA